MILFRDEGEAVKEAFALQFRVQQGAELHYSSDGEPIQPGEWFVQESEMDHSLSPTWRTVSLGLPSQKAATLHMERLVRMLEAVRAPQEDSSQEDSPQEEMPQPS